MQSASSASAPSNSAPIVLHTGIIKLVLSGDAVVIRGVPRGGPPPEKQVNLSNIIAPRLARRPMENSPETKDEPFAWEAREFLREKLIGKEVCFTVEYKVPASGREYGCVYLGKNTEAENVAESLVSEGLVEVRQQGNRSSNEYLQKLDDLQNSAKAAGKGKWGPPEVCSKHVRDIKWSQENPRMFVDSLHQEPQKAVIEHVRDGSTIRAFLLPTFDYVTVMISGVKAPGFRSGDSGDDEEAFAKESRFFIESRLLQRDVEIVFESVSNQNYYGSIIHPNGNIAEVLLKEGLARVLDWTMGIVTGGAERLRAAERVAKDKRLRMWKNYEPLENNIDLKDKSFQAKVVEIVNADALVVRRGNDAVQKIWLSSLRPPRQDDMLNVKEENQVRQFRPLYDIPFMFEAREFLRKKLIGKKVQVNVDYIQPAANQFPERSCCTVSIGGQNVAEALVLKGYATVVRHRQDDEKRSSAYDQLLSAEAKAEKGTRGLHMLRKGKQENGMLPQPPTVRVQELQGDANRSKQFLPYLQRAGRSDAIVEFVASGSRVRLYVPKETCLITFLLSGINCARGSRPGPGKTMIEAEPYGEEAARFTRNMCLQHEVQIEVETMDRAGNFVGWMFLDGRNVAQELIEAGYASVHFTAERSKYYSLLLAAEESAKQQRKGMWEHGVPVEETEEAEEKENLTSGGNVERKVNYRSVAITEVNPKTLNFWAQSFDNGPKLEQMMTELRNEFTLNPPLSGAYSPRKSELCAARFSADNLWYRAKVEACKTRDHVEVLFIDFGNREITTASQLAALPAAFHSIPQGAHEYALAFVKVPDEDPDATEAAAHALQEEAFQYPSLLINAEYRVAGVEYVTLCSPAGPSQVDIGKKLVEGGYVLANPRREQRLQNIISEYTLAMEGAKKARLNIWRYGDFTGTEI